MKIGLINLDCKLPNIALEKIKLYYNAQYIEPIESYNYDKVFCSSIFMFTDKNYVQPSWICGGSGFDLTTNLPPEIEKMKPKINYGFTTRGCIRKCSFCVVPEKEGKIKAVGDIYDIWDGKSKDIVLYDNNILGLPEHFELICKQITKEKLRVDFNQGLDFRLLTNEVCKILKKTSHKQYRFAFDNIKHENGIKKAINLLKKSGINRAIWYVIVGYNSNFEEDFYRAIFLKKNGQNASIQRYDYGIKKYERIYNYFANWVAEHGFFHKLTFQEHCKKANYDIPQEYLKIIEKLEGKK